MPDYETVPLPAPARRQTVSVPNIAGARSAVALYREGRARELSPIVVWAYLDAMVTSFDALADELGRVEALIDHARKISPSPSMHIYVADLERALGMDAPRPHKTGSNG